MLVSHAPDGCISGERHAVLGQDLRGHNAQSTQQSPAGMDDLNDPVAGESGLQARAHIAFIGGQYKGRRWHWKHLAEVENMFLGVEHLSV